MRAFPQFKRCLVISFLGQLLLIQCAPCEVVDDTPKPANDETASATVSPAPAPVADEQLLQLEKRFFAHTYGNESPEIRLARLEHFVFGATSSGDTQSRLARLNKVLPAKETPANVAQGQQSTAAKPPEKPHSLIDVINEGIDNYNTHRYHNAEDNFEQACAMAPGMSRPHSYLAATKMQINERQSAIDEFRTSYELDPFGKFGRYAKTCLIELGGDEAVRSKGPVDSKHDLDQAIDKINNEAAQDVFRHRREGMVANASRQRSLIFRGNYSRDTYVVAHRNAAEATRRAASVEESANNLKHLLAGKSMPGDAKLRAWGTTLNTHYYGNETRSLAPDYIPREYPRSLRAIALSFKSKPTATKKSGTSLPSKSKKKKTR